jgi:hypothetical protein
MVKLIPRRVEFRSLAKMLSLREVHIWYGDLKYWGVHAIKHT